MQLKKVVLVVVVLILLALPKPSLSYQMPIEQSPSNVACEIYMAFFTYNNWDEKNWMDLMKDPILIECARHLCKELAETYVGSWKGACRYV